MFKPTVAKTPEEYISKIDEPRMAEIQKIFDFIKAVLPNEEPYIQTGMIAFKPYHFKYESGREGDWFVVGLASQKNYISVYICAAVNGEYVAEKRKKELGKVSVGRSCVRFKKIEDLNLDVLKTVILEGVEATPAM